MYPSTNIYLFKSTLLNIFNYPIVFVIMLEVCSDESVGTYPRPIKSEPATQARPTDKIIY